MARISIVCLALFVPSLVFGASFGRPTYPTPTIPEWNDKQATSIDIHNFLEKGSQLLQQLRGTNVVDLLNQKGARNTAFVEWIDNCKDNVINVFKSLLVDLDLLSNYKPKDQVERLCFDQYKEVGLPSIHKKINKMDSSLHNYTSSALEYYVNMIKTIDVKKIVESINQSDQRDKKTEDFFQNTISIPTSLFPLLDEDSKILSQYESEMKNSSSCYDWYKSNVLNSQKKQITDMHEFLKNGVNSLYNPLASSSPTL